MKTNSQIKRGLEGRLGKQAVVVIKPDHPFMFAGPDILIGHAGHMMSCFRQGKTETQERLLSRLMATRIAIPRSVCVLLANKELPHFDITLDDDNPKIIDHLSEALTSEPKAERYQNPVSDHIIQLNLTNMMEYPYGGYWSSLEDSPQKAKELGLDIFSTEENGFGHHVDWTEDWLKAVMEANEFQGYSVVAKNQPIIIVTNSWPKTPKVEIANRFGSMNILCLSVTHIDEIQATLTAIKDFQETTNPQPRR
jgi:hypothetical protein